MSRTYDTLVEENIQLQSSLGKYKTLVDRLNSDNKTLQQMYSDLKENFEKIKKSSTLNLHKIEELNKENRDQEAHFELTIKTLQTTMENKQAEIEELQQKISPNLNNDYEMMKVRVLNEVNEKHQLELNDKAQEIENLKEQRMKIQNELQLKSLDVSEEKKNIERVRMIEKETLTVQIH